MAAVCKVANEEHARDLPLINGIKEDIKSTVVMEAGTPFHQEALLNLSSRFKTLEVGNCFLSSKCCTITVFLPGNT